MKESECMWGGGSKTKAVDNDKRNLITPMTEWVNICAKDYSSSSLLFMPFSFFLSIVVSAAVEGKRSSE